MSSEVDHLLLDLERVKPLLSVDALQPQEDESVRLGESLSSLLTGQRKSQGSFEKCSQIGKTSPGPSERQANDQPLLCFYLSSRGEKMTSMYLLKPLNVCHVFHEAATLQQH